MIALISPISVRAKSDIKISVGESYEINKLGIIFGFSASYKDGIIIGKRVGTSLLIIKENGYPEIRKIVVEKSGIKVSMLDIGQGDSFLLQVNGRNILLDTGERKYYNELCRQLEYLNVDRIDALIVSHMDIDHMGSATLIIKDYKPKIVFRPSVCSDSVECERLLKTIAYNCADEIVRANSEYVFGSDCKMTILSADYGDSTNDSSIVFRLDYYDNSFLFTGDASASVLNDLMESNQNVKADVLKVPHHGSASTSPILFLKNVGAKLSLISVGKSNAYGHPDSNVVRRLRMYCGEVLRTDEKGTVIITGDGNTLKYECVKIIDWDLFEKLTVESGTYIGNVKSMIVHQDFCNSLPAEHNRVFFNSVEDAEILGYRKCRNCFGE